MSLMRIAGTGLLGLGLFAGGCYAGDSSGYKRGVAEGKRIVEEYKGIVEIAIKDYLLEVLGAHKKFCDKTGVSTGIEGRVSE